MLARPHLRRYFVFPGRRKDPPCCHQQGNTIDVLINSLLNLTLVGLHSAIDWAKNIDMEAMNSIMKMGGGLDYE